jgi:hypothetical protein
MMSRSPHNAPKASDAPKTAARVHTKTGEFDGEVGDMSGDFEEDEGADGSVQAVGDGNELTVPVDDPGSADRDPDMSGRERARRDTVVSPIPAMLAASMTTHPEAKPPTPLPGQLSAVVIPAGSHADLSSAYTVEVESGSQVDTYNRVSDLIDAMHSAFDVRDFQIAARMAEEAMSTAEGLGTPAVLELLSETQPLFERVFGSFVGPLGRTPTLARPWEEIAAHRLADSTRSFLSRIDGVRTLEQTLGHSSIPPQHALRIAASALRAGFIKVT